MSTLPRPGMILGSDTEDVDLIFRNIDPSKLHTSRISLEEFHKRTPLPVSKYTSISFEESLMLHFRHVGYVFETQRNVSATQKDLTDVLAAFYERKSVAGKER